MLASLFPYILPCSGGRGQTSQHPSLVNPIEKRASLVYQLQIDAQTDNREEARKDKEEREGERDQGRIPFSSAWLMFPPPVTGEMAYYDWPDLEDKLTLLSEGREPHKIGERQFCMIKGLLFAEEGRWRCWIETSYRQWLLCIFV